uniref:Myoneurin-like n=1 Tax=Sinocyclocheilus rhinocerous TaxID=307959 RepID=A0A673NF56_9TELE
MPHITHSEFLLEQLKRQRERSFLCDCTVTIGQSQYHAHHNVLAAFSEYFSTLSIDAGKENATITLDPELVSGAVFEKLLTYIYTGDLSMDREEIESVQKAASYLGMPEVVARCTLTQEKIGGSPTRQAEYEDPRSPLSPDDYEPLEPIAEVEEREWLREKKEDGLQDDEAQSSSEPTPQRSGSKRGRKPKTRLDDVESETITAHRGRGRGRGRPRGRPRVRPLTSDSTEQSPAQKTMSPNSSSVGRGTGRPRGRPRVRPLSTDRDDSGNEQGDAQETEVVEEDSVNAGEEDDGQVKTDVENPDGGLLKRGRGRPRTKPLTTENQTTNTENATTDTEDGSEPAKTKENEGTGRKRGRPRSKPLSSEAPESSNPTDKAENSGEEASGETNQDAEKHTEECSSQCTEDSKSNPAKKVRTSNRKRSLSRKLKESQASNEEEDDVEDEEFGNDKEDWAGEEEVKPLQDKHRPICNVCGNLFSEMSSLRRHMRIHKGLKPYQCQLCTRSFRQGNQLKTHMRIHTGEKPFSCTSCEAGFSQKCQLVYHCRMHHGEEKPHKCDFCGAAFATSSNLKIHIRKHSGEKPYECGECGKRFTQASTLMYHKRRHTGEKPYICDTCGMAFAVSSSLIAHTRKHTGVTPYICLDCGKPCLTAGELRKHMDIHNDMYSLKKHSILKHNGAPLETDPTQCPLNIPIDHQGLIARVRSALVDSQDHEIQMEHPLPILPPETSLIIQQSAEPQMIIQHADGTEPSMIFQHADSSEAPVLIQHGESGEQVSYVVEQYEIPGNAEMEHTQIVIVQTID